jgi:hypothetical protein
MNDVLMMLWALSPFLVFVSVCLIAMIVKGEK